MGNIFNIAKVITECEAESHRILNIYIRYMIKKFKLTRYNNSLFITCPNFEKYILHLMGIILQARKCYHFNSKLIKYPLTGCREIDLLVSKWIKRKYKVNLSHSNKYKDSKNLLLKPFKFNLFLFLKDIIFFLRPKVTTDDFLDFNTNNHNKGILIISHNIFVAPNAHTNLSKQLIKYFEKNDKLSTKLITPNEIGLTIYDKFKNLFFIVKQLFLKIKFCTNIKLSDLNFLISDCYRILYKNKLKKYYLKNNINIIICDIIDYRYEPIYYETAKELKIKYFKYDYSLGYPIKQNSFLRYLPDTRKYCDVIFSSSRFRSEQYQKATNHLNKPPVILPHICPQSDYSRSRKFITKQEDSKIKIGIVDNCFSDDCGLSYRDINSLILILVNNFQNQRFILQSKYGFLEKEFKKLKFDYKDLESASKGDFSPLRNADLIISLGWQSIALKASYFFNKPLLFYSQSGYPYKEFIFSNDKKKNSSINHNCQILWTSEKDLHIKLISILKEKNKFNFIKEKSQKLLNEIGFYDDNIESYFKSNY
tara:strand:+ start:852 stop:2462 length:1611 start_codon:yes stop_codon:yes gene_type:complete